MRIGMSRQATIAFTAAAISLNGCAGGPASRPGVIAVSPQSFASRRPAHMPSWYREAPAAVEKGVYVGEALAQAVYGYFPSNDGKNNGPVCTLSPGSYVQDIDSDRAGNVIVPLPGGLGVQVYSGASMCGPSLGTIADTSRPISAASRNAATSTIYVANEEGEQGQRGTVSICTLAAGCTAMLSTPVLNTESSIVADVHGNVYLSGDVTPYGTGALVLFDHGRGVGHVITAYVNASGGALDFDRSGNLVAIDPYVRGVGQVYVYSGCPDNCSPHGPWFLQGLSSSAKVNRKGDRLYVADYANGTVDVYRYEGINGINYAYSISTGLTQDLQVSGVAVTPATP